MSQKNCLICNSSNNPLIKHKTYKCNECGHVFLNYTGDGLLYHKELYRKGSNEGSRGGGEVKEGRFTNKFHERRNEICNKRVAAIEPYLQECKSLLDVGAGGGTFLNKLRGRIDELEATEISDLCVDNLRKDGYVTYHGAFTHMDLPKKYDVVTSWHVLEHVENVKEFPVKAHNVTGKYLIIEVPINRTLRNPDHNFDGHFHYFTKKSLELLFKDHFHILDIRGGIQAPALLAVMESR